MRRAAVKGSEQLEVLPAREVTVEVRGLDEAGDAVESLRRLSLRVTAEQADLAAVGRDQAEEDAHRRRLAGAVRAEEAVDVADTDGEIDIAHRDDSAIALDEPARDDRKLGGVLGHNHRR